MAEMQIYRGGCHCGCVRYEVETTLDPVISCNCSICQKQGSLWAFPKPEQFTLLSGADDLADYQFNRKIIHHLFCRNCGVAPFARGKNADGSEAVSINVRCLDDLDLDALTLTPFDGKSL
ncbi:MAG TPA: GFA family protein [Methyloceanibacter sp.]|nr:GFA family protein [Methyloceanibacter sp.]